MLSGGEVPMRIGLKSYIGLARVRVRSFPHMKRLFQWGFALLLCAACLIPASASAYYYNGRYYRYRYHGRYYPYYYNHRYYHHRGWVVGIGGRPGYYRYW